MVHIITLVYKTHIFTLLVCSLIAPLVQVEIANHLELIATLISIKIRPQIKNRQGGGQNHPPLGQPPNLKDVNIPRVNYI